MLGKASWVVVAAVFVSSMVLTGVAEAQTPTWQDVQVRDIERQGGR